MGQKIVLAGVNFTDQSLPVLRDDPILSAGSLALVDFGHSLGGIDAVPSNGDPVPNIAWSIASDLVESESVSPVIVANYDGAGMAAELSAKGGLHVIKSQVGDTNTTRFVVKLPTAIIAYMLANKSNKFFLSMWHEVTRKAESNSLPIAAIAHSSYSVDFILNMQSNGAPGGSAANRLGLSSNLNPSAATGTAKQQVAVNGSTGTVSSLVYADLFIFGGVPSTGPLTGAVNKGGSHILYRCYLEDLTVSGRTYEEVKAIDDQLFAAAFSPGGKFYGDTFTDPATLP